MISYRKQQNTLEDMSPVSQRPQSNVHTPVENTAIKCPFNKSLFALLLFPLPLFLTPIFNAHRSSKKATTVQVPHNPSMPSVSVTSRQKRHAVYKVCVFLICTALVGASFSHFSHLLQLLLVKGPLRPQLLNPVSNENLARVKRFLNVE